ncbi:serine/threonine-protein kinase Nek11-like [Lethenteron reissneri]|nr:serine/threonine-protein kinase Nek11-like [Lethenteron reissneri]XP_061437709.1 serine/threonine-protein kinase Nek11-like [Lethenteron reissneri]XP_061437710.1 serine/threonine-protein kinase Nek11-like [Lethenteron reissneri]XP_061437711.1 serine/threonine-protein kinase Nek11-like [Lethenteron reissneri]XP_061437712.1 serine/threonine-protein kinase Nek11-like [Lethenteron reissneri]
MRRRLKGCGAEPAAALAGGRYELLGPLGHGAFGRVHLARDTEAAAEDATVVLKEVPLRGAAPGHEARALAEARLLSRLGHPAVLRFHGSFVQDASLYIVTEHCEGGDLHMAVERRRQEGSQFALPRVVEWFVQLLLGLQHLHDRHILHRDLKTRNIFLKSGMVKIGDFGVSRVLAGPADLALTFTGTLHYMSPEALQCRGYNSKSDVW